MFYINLFISAFVISFASWLSKKYPVIAGFIVALPLTTMLVLPMAYLQNGSLETTQQFAKSIFFAIPISLLFFIPLIFYKKIGGSFWIVYGLGCILLVLGYLLHKAVLNLWS